MVPPLYKFSSINEVEPEKCFTLDSLRKCYVYFASVTTLNDPFEMGAYLDQVSDLDAARNEFMTHDWSGSEMGQALASMNAKEREAYLRARWESDEWREQLIEGLKSKDGFDDDLKKQMSIFCASGTNNDGLLWAHYASGHRGIAIELDCNGDDVLRNSYPVTYQEEFPVIDVLHDDMKTNFQKGMLTKAEAWKYEDEYRAIYPLPRNGVEHPVESSAFVSIIFGAKTSQRTRDLVVEATRPHLSPITFKLAKLGKRSFDVSFEEYQVES